MSTRTGILRGEAVAEVEEENVRVVVAGIEIIATAAGATVRVLITTETVEEANMMMTGVVEVDLMGGNKLLLISFLLYIFFWESLSELLSHDIGIC